MVEVKQSARLIFYRFDRKTYVRIGEHLFYLFPIQPKDGQTIKRIWRRAEEIDSYTQLMSYCGGGDRVRLHVSNRKL